MSVHKHSSFVGSSLILAGTAIGAGMLALPLVASSIGFWPMLGIFLVTAFFAVISALIMYEANMAIEPGCNLYTMASRTLGRTGRFFSTLAPLGLFYALMAAYLSAGGSLFERLFEVFIPRLSAQLNIILFATLSCVFVYTGTKVVDYLNRLLFTFMLIFLAGVLFILLPEVKYTAYHFSTEFNLLPFIAAIPVVYTSFGFHGSIPSIILYQKNNLDLICLIYVIAVIIPLLVYFLWLVSVMENLPIRQLSDIGQSSDSTARLIESLTLDNANSSRLVASLHMFSNFALLTSVLGVSLGLFDYLANLMNRDNNHAGRAQTTMVTFIPAIMIAIAFPDGFVTALGYAAIALSILAIILPAMIVLTVRKKIPDQNIYRAPGGNGMVLLTLFFGIIVIAAQLYSSI